MCPNKSALATLVEVECVGDWWKWQRTLYLFMN